MAGPKPVLYNGLAQTQGIWDVATTPVVPVGTRGALDDGRVFYYARNVGAAALIAGELIQHELVSDDFDDLATDTVGIGAKVVNVTPVNAATYTRDALAGGYLCVNSGTTGAGMWYKIKSHPATVAATPFDLELADPIAVAFAANTTATVIKNPWMDTVIAAVGGAGLCVGIAPIAVPAGDTTAQYYWAQTWGIAAVAATDTTVAGSALMTDTGTAGTAGQTLIAVAGRQILGINMFAAVAGDFCPTFLTIAG